MRNIAGLIVIDFIDMTSNANNFKVEKKMRQLFQNDKSRVQMNKISQFGLMEISRQRVGHSIYEIFFNTCECCDGNGFIKSKNIIFQEITSTIKNIIAVEKIEEIDLKIDKDFFIDNKDELLERIKIFLPKKIKINYFCEEKINKYFEFNNNLLEKIAHNLKNTQIKLSEKQVKLSNKEIKKSEESEESNIKDTKSDNKRYTRKIKKKTSDVTEKKIKKRKQEIKNNEIPESEKTYRRKIKKKTLVEKDNTDNNTN